VSRTSELFLTFDVEDFINEPSMGALRFVLSTLKRHRLKGLFFLTGHMAEKLGNFQEILDLLEVHDIGYHSASHSVRPGIFEYTDIENYSDAVKISLQRETSHVDPLSGKIQGPGGITLLREMFPNKTIDAFRAPGFSWSPPHLEALRTLSVRYDFSSAFSLYSVCHKNVTFFPLPILIDTISSRVLLISILRRKSIVLDFHPGYLVTKDWWDSPYFFGENPRELFKVPSREFVESKRLFKAFEKGMKTINRLMKLRLVKTGELTKSQEPLKTLYIDVQKVYDEIALWPLTRFNYRPKFIYSHLLSFLDLNRGEIQTDVISRSSVSQD
jgi:hypothetical protein